MATKQVAPSVYTFGILTYIDDRHAIMPEVNVELQIYRLHISILQYTWGISESTYTYRYLGYVPFPNPAVMKIQLVRFDMK
jgi:hypothetical protein